MPPKRSVQNSNPPKDLPDWLSFGSGNDSVESTSDELTKTSSSSTPTWLKSSETTQKGKLSKDDSSSTPSWLQQEAKTKLSTSKGESDKPSWLREGDSKESKLATKNEETQKPRSDSPLWL